MCSSVAMDIEILPCIHGGVSTGMDVLLCADIGKYRGVTTHIEALLCTRSEVMTCGEVLSALRWSSVN